MGRRQERRATAAAWATSNPVLADGELGVEAGDAGARRVKVGNGVTAWTALPYLDQPTSDGGEIPADYPRTVLVVTGDEARPAADVVLWISPDGTPPVNAADTDVTLTPATSSPTGDTTSPSAPTGLTASSITSSGFSLTWTAASDDTAVTAYDVEVGGTVIASPSTASQAVTDLTPLTNYTVRVRARDAAGNVSAWVAVSGGVTTASGAPAALFSDDFNRANGAAAGWTATGGGAANIVSNALVFSGWSAYGRGYRSGFPKNISARAVLTGGIQDYQGIFVGHTEASGAGVKLFWNGSSWVIGHSADANAFNAPFSPSGYTPPVTRLRLDLSGSTVTAFINDVQVQQTTLSALGITLDTDSGNVYEAGYCGEAKAPGLDSFEVWAA